MATVAQNNFPDSLQTGFDNGDFTLTDSGVLNSLARYYFFDDANGRQRFAMEYLVGNDSTHDAQNDFGQLIALYGRVWFSGFRNYTPDDGFFGCGTKPVAGFTIYLEQVQPIEFPIGNFYDSTVFVSLNREALLQGQGEFSWLVDDDFAVGSMCSDGPIFCLGFECEIGASINLIGLDFVEANNGDYQLNLDFSDTRTMFYDHYSSAPEYKGQPGFITCQRYELGCATGGSGIPGDVNGDEAVNLLDVDPFICVLQSGNYVAEADLSNDGFVSLLDVLFFVDLLSEL
ncbi:MAG: dockerin type I domain-containing protein [Planctomycetota bacterium]